MPTGNIQCPNCGCSFEYNSDKTMAECPQCHTQFMVRDVKMESTVVNNYNYGSNQGGEKTNSISKEYQHECEKLIAYAQHSENDKVNKQIKVISNEYPNSYFYEIINLYEKHNYYYAFLSPDKYHETKKNRANDCSDNKLIASDMLLEMITSLKRDGYSITQGQEGFLRVKDKNGNPTNEYQRFEFEDAIEFFESYIDFVNDVEESRMIKKNLKYDFEKEHYDELIRLKEDATNRLAVYKEYKDEFLSFVKNNKLKCGEFLDELEEAKGSGIGAIRNDNESTGFFCDIIGLVLMVVGLILTIIFAVNEYVSVLALPIMVMLAGYVVSFIGFMRYRGGGNGHLWFFIILPFAFIPFFLVRAIITFVDVGKLNASNRRKRNEQKAIFDSLAKYRAAVIYDAVEDMADAFEFDYSRMTK